MEPTQRTDQMVQQILRRMRERVAAQAAPVIPAQQPMAGAGVPPHAYASPPTAAPQSYPMPQPFPTAPPPGPDVLAAMQSMPLFPAQNAPPAPDYAWAKQFVPGGVPELAQDYYAQQIAHGRSDDPAGYYNATGTTEYNHMYSPDWQ